MNELSFVVFSVDIILKWVMFDRVLTFRRLGSYRDDVSSVAMREGLSLKGIVIYSDLFV